MVESPKVFISYSHDSPEHRRWVLELGTKLVQNGVDVILDQWDLTPGDNFTQFMEAGVRDRDWVLVICTDNYVRKANDREGGVGYEVQIVTAQLVKNLGINKFIPIIRHASAQEKMPTFLGGRVYIDFTDDSQFNEKFNDLLRKLYGVPIEEKPPLGEKPSFAKQKVLPAQGTDARLPEIPEQVESASEAYSAAVEIVRTGDEFGWRHLVKGIKPNVFNSLVQWQQNESDKQRPESKEQREQVADTAVEIISPLISVALAGVESGREQFRDQRSIFDDLLNIAGWNSNGGWGAIPRALGYVYHSLHGSLSLNTSQLDLALSLARTKIPALYTTAHLHVWEEGELMGWANLFGPSCIKNWNYLAKACDRWKWLVPIFGDELEYQTSLVAYYIALDIHELASTINSDRPGKQSGSKKIPLDFISEGRDINQRAISLLLRNPEALMGLWASLNVTREQMESSQGDWIRASEDWLRNVYKFSLDTRIYHENLSKILQP